MKTKPSPNVHSVVAIVLGTFAAGLFVAMLVLLIVADWQIFSIAPSWLLPLLLLLFGVFTMLASVFAFLSFRERENEPEAVVCAQCQAECTAEAAFCPYCGAKLVKDE